MRSSCTGDNDDVVALLHLPLAETEDLADAAADTVAHDGMAELGANRDAEAIVPQSIFPVIDHKAGRNTGFTLCVHPAEFIIFLDGGGAFHA